MTIREYITSKFQTFGITLSDADMIDISMSVDVDEQITEANRLEALRAVATSVIPQLLLRAKSISENGFSISWDNDALLKYYAWLCAQLGIDDTLNSSVVRDITGRW